MDKKKKQLIKEQSKRPVYIILSVLLIILMLQVLIIQNEAYEGVNHWTDDYLNAGSAILTIMFIAFSRNKKSMKELMNQDKVIAVLFFGAFIMQLGVLLSNFRLWSNPDYVLEIIHDEGPALLIMAFIYINRFR